MTGASLAQALVERGLQPSEHAGKLELFDLVHARHTALNQSRRTRVHAWWVPGRLEVFGKHTDYAGGRTLVCAVPRGFAVIASPRADGVVNAVDARNDESLSLQAPFEEAFTGWRNYVRVVARRLSRNFPESALGADIVFASDLPRASGMSSSSALMISVATVLARLETSNVARSGRQTSVRHSTWPVITPASRTVSASAPCRAIPASALTVAAKTTPRF
jgi:galactokinase